MFVCLNRFFSCLLILSIWMLVLRQEFIRSICIILRKLLGPHFTTWFTKNIKRSSPRSRKCFNTILLNNEQHDKAMNWESKTLSSQINLESTKVLPKSVPKTTLRTSCFESVSSWYFLCSIWRQIEHFDSRMLPNGRKKKNRKWFICRCDLNRQMWSLISGRIFPGALYIYISI